MIVMRSIAALLGTVTALVLCTASSALAANNFDGSCGMSVPPAPLTGDATFTKPLAGPPLDTTYAYKGTGTCDGTLNGNAVKGAAVVLDMTGAGSLSCSGGQAPGGTGTLTFTKGTADTSDDVVITVKVDLYWFGSEWLLDIKGTGSGEAGGHGSGHFNADQGLGCTGQASPDGISNFHSWDVGVSKISFDVEFRTFQALIGGPAQPASCPTPDPKCIPAPPSSGGSSSSSPSGPAAPASGSSKTPATPAAAPKQAPVKIAAAHGRAQRVSDVVQHGLSVTVDSTRPALSVLRAKIDASVARALGLKVPRGATRVQIGLGGVLFAGPGHRGALIPLTPGARRALAHAKSVSIRIDALTLGGDGPARAQTSIALAR